MEILETQGEKWRTAGKGLGWQEKEAAAGEYKQGPDREALDEEKICSWLCEALVVAALRLSFSSRTFIWSLLHLLIHPFSTSVYMSLNCAVYAIFCML